MQSLKTISAILATIVILAVVFFQQHSCVETWNAFGFSNCQQIFLKTHSTFPDKFFFPPNFCHLEINKKLLEIHETSN